MLYPVTKAATNLSQPAGVACLIVNQGTKTVYLDKGSTVSPNSYSVLLAPKQSFNWSGGELWAVCAAGDTSTVSLMPGADTSVSPITDVTVTGPVAISGTVPISGDVGFTGPVTVAGGVDINAGTVDIGNVSVNGALSIGAALSQSVIVLNAVSTGNNGGGGTGYLNVAAYNTITIILTAATGTQLRVVFGGLAATFRTYDITTTMEITIPVESGTVAIVPAVVGDTATITVIGYSMVLPYSYIAKTLTQPSVGTLTATVRRRNVMVKLSGGNSVLQLVRIPTYTGRVTATIMFIGTVASSTFTFLEVIGGVNTFVYPQITLATFAGQYEFNLPDAPIWLNYSLGAGVTGFAIELTAG